MLVRKGNQFRLYPTVEQAQQMAQFAGACRFVYNLALEQREAWWRPGRRFSFAGQCREVTDLRASVDWLKAAPVHALQGALRDLDRAYTNFFAGRAGYPRPRRKGIDDSFRFPDPHQFSIERTGNSSGMMKLPKLGRVRFRGWHDLHGEPKNITISRKAGMWFASVQCKREADEPAASKLPTVGIDMGIAAFATLSDGRRIEALNAGKRALRSLRKAQRALARKRRGSNNRRKAIRRVAKIQTRVANARKDFLHKVSTTIAKSHGVVVVEALRVRNMSASAKGTVEEPGRKVRQKAGLNRSILDQGWGSFRTMLAYKLAERGGKLVEVDPRNTSITCTECGIIDKTYRISQSQFVCGDCGHEAHADVNAAINILAKYRRGDTALKPVEGQRTKRPVEAGTTRLAA